MIERISLFASFYSLFPIPFSLLVTFFPQKEGEAERRQTLFTNRRILRCGAHPAGRARLSAFHHGSHLREYLIPKARLQARLPGTRSERAFPAFACPSPGSTSHPGRRSGTLINQDAR